MGLKTWFDESSHWGIISDTLVKGLREAEPMGWIQAETPRSDLCTLETQGELMV